VPSNVDLSAAHRAAASPPTYRRLLRVPGFRRLLISSLLTRTASQMWTVGLVIFALQRYHSPGVAGLSLFLLIFPGLMLSPIAGALLDRHGRKRLMTLDFIVAAVCLAVIVVLAAANRLPVWGLYALLVGGSVTSTLSLAGARSFFPLIVPRDLWDRGNAADSVLYGVANIAGPGLAGAVACLPLRASGTFAECCISFIRSATADSSGGEQLRDKWIAVIAPRLSSRVGFPPIGELWKDTIIEFPETLSLENAHDLFTCHPIPLRDRQANLADALSFLPFAVITNLG